MLQGVFGDGLLVFGFGEGGDSVAALFLGFLEGAFLFGSLQVQARDETRRMMSVRLMRRAIECEV